MKKSPCRTLSLLLVTAAVYGPATAQDNSAAEELQRQIRERDAEISILKQQLETLRSQQPTTIPSVSNTSVGNALSTMPPAPVQRAGAATAGSSAVKSTGNAENEEDELATALESSLVRQGGAVLSSGTIEFEPELSYFYDEPNTGTRRDGFGTALSLRFGLPAAMQAELYVPYVIRDRQAGIDSTTSGLGDVSLGLTKQLAKDQDGMPALLVFGRWRTTTGDIDRAMPTGFGQHALQVGLTATKRMDPTLLFGSVSYTTNLGTAHLRNGTRLNAGNVFGARLGANLAATPDTSFYWGVSYNSSSADHFNGERVDLTDRARGYLEMGSTTVIAYGKFLNLGVAFGVTPAAPKLSVTASLPIRF
jgi:hypothetical protein